MHLKEMTAKHLTGAHRASSELAVAERPKAPVREMLKARVIYRLTTSYYSYIYIRARDFE